MNFNLSGLLKAINSKISSPTVEAVKFYLTEDNMILAKMGEVSYYFDYKKLQMVLDGNEFNHYYKDDTQEKINELLSKHVINQLTAANGEKWYPEIKTVFSDINTH
jgi:hypothetical protein